MPNHTPVQSMNANLGWVRQAFKSKGATDLDLAQMDELIEQANSLLTACKAVVDGWDDDEIGQIDGSLIDTACAAIAKASA